MKYFSLIFKTCAHINQELTNKFTEDEIWFLRASLHEIVYGTNEMEIIFNYSPERYNYGKDMILKGIVVKINYDSHRLYSINEIISFCNNKFQNYNSEYKVYGTQEAIGELLLFIETTSLKENSAWENEFIKYNQNKYKIYGKE